MAAANGRRKAKIARLLRAAPVAVAAAMSAGYPTGAESGKTFTLSIEPETAAFRAECTLHMAGGGTETVTLASDEKLQRTFQAQALSCRVEQTTGPGRLQVEIRSSTGSVSRSSTSGRHSTLAIAAS
jgi:hypothetical protein